MIRDDIKASILLETCKGKLQEHLELNFSRSKTYEDMKLEVESYIEKKSEQDADKMDLSMINYGQKKCHNCGKPGHEKKDCRAPGGGAHNPTRWINEWSGGQFSGHGKKGDGKGKSGKGKGHFHGYCSNCFRWGHRAADCQFEKGSGKGFSAGKGFDKGKSKGKSSFKGKGKGKGKSKGKSLNELEDALAKAYADLESVWNENSQWNGDYSSSSWIMNSFDYEPSSWSDPSWYDDSWWNGASNDASGIASGGGAASQEEQPPEQPRQIGGLGLCALSEVARTRHENDAC